jgi:sec-independent protein translocase protein TatA
MNLHTLAFFSLPGGVEWLVILIVGLLLFGRRLPEVARSLGKSIVEFKKGIKDVRDDIEDHTRLEPPSTPRIEQQPPSSTPSNSSTDKPAGIV